MRRASRASQPSHRGGSDDAGIGSWREKAKKASVGWVKARLAVFDKTVLTIYEARHRPMPVEQSHSVYRFEHMAECPPGEWQSSRKPMPERTFEQQARLREKMSEVALQKVKESGALESEASHATGAPPQQPQQGQNEHPEGADSAPWSWLWTGATQWVAEALPWIATDPKQSEPPASQQSSPNAVQETPVVEAPPEPVDPPDPPDASHESAEGSSTSTRASRVSSAGKALANRVSSAGKALATRTHAVDQAVDDDAVVARIVSAVRASTSSEQAAERTALANRVFDEADADKSGSIELNELRSALETLGLTPSAGQLRAVMARYDDDNSGSICMEEFSGLIEALDEEMIRERIQDARAEAVARAAPRRKRQAGDTAVIKMETRILAEIAARASGPVQAGKEGAEGSSTSAHANRVSSAGKALATRTHAVDQAVDDDAVVARIVSAVRASTSSEQAAERTALANRVFDEADADKSGSIELNELRSALETLGLTPSAGQLRAVMARYDDDNSGSICMEEFSGLIEALDEEMIRERIQDARAEAVARAAPRRKRQAGDTAVIKMETRILAEIAARASGPVQAGNNTHAAKVARVNVPAKASESSSAVDRAEEPSDGSLGTRMKPERTVSKRALAYESAVRAAAETEETNKPKPREEVATAKKQSKQAAAAKKPDVEAANTAKPSREPQPSVAQWRRCLVCGEPFCDELCSHCTLRVHVPPGGLSSLGCDFDELREPHRGLVFPREYIVYVDAIATGSFAQAQGLAFGYAVVAVDGTSTCGLASEALGELLLAAADHECVISFLPLSVVARGEAPPPAYPPPAAEAAAAASGAAGRPAMSAWQSKELLTERAGGLPTPFDASRVGTCTRHGMAPVGGVGQPKSNQDSGLVCWPFNGSEREAVFAAFDGHGQLGECVSQFCARNLPLLLERELSASVGGDPAAAGGTRRGGPGGGDPAAALARAFAALDGRLAASRQLAWLDADEDGADGVTGLAPSIVRKAGTTATVVYMRGGDCWVACVGDSRCVLGSAPPSGGSAGAGNGLVARDLSTEHKPDDPEERKRLTSAGGVVTEAGASGKPPARIFTANRSHGLAMSRAIGDLTMRKVGVLPEPTVRHVEIASNDRLLCVASDGIWEFIPSQEACDIAARHANDATAACEALVREAQRRWADNEKNYRDDITCTVVRLPLLASGGAGAAARALEA